MIYGIGVDILSLSRFQKLVSRRGAERIARRILSPRERDDLVKLPSGSRSDFLAVRWAVKEAAYKACFPMGKDKNWKDVSFVKNDQGKPVLLHPFENYRMHASISHDSGSVVAMVVIEKQVVMSQ